MFIVQISKLTFINLFFSYVSAHSLIGIHVSCWSLAFKPWFKFLKKENWSGDVNTKSATLRLTNAFAETAAASTVLHPSSRTS